MFFYISIRSSHRNRLKSLEFNEVNALSSDIII